MEEWFPEDNWDQKLSYLTVPAYTIKAIMTSKDGMYFMTTL